MKAALVGDVPEIYRSGPRGGVWDTIVLTRPWGFSPAAITVQAFLWHGEQDVNVPLAMGRFPANAIPQCDARFIPNEGHLMYVNHWPKIVRALSGSVATQRL